MAWSAAREEADLRPSQEAVTGLLGTGDYGSHSSGSSWSANTLSAGAYVESRARQDLWVNDGM